MCYLSKKLSKKYHFYIFLKKSLRLPSFFSLLGFPLRSWRTSHLQRCHQSSATTTTVPGGRKTKKSFLLHFQSLNWIQGRKYPNLSLKPPNPPKSLWFLKVLEGTLVFLFFEIPFSRTLVVRKGFHPEKKPPIIGGLP